MFKFSTVLVALSMASFPASIASVNAAISLLFSLNTESRRINAPIAASAPIIIGLNDSAKIASSVAPAAAVPTILVVNLLNLLILLDSAKPCFSFSLAPAKPSCSVFSATLLSKFNRSDLAAVCFMILSRASALRLPRFARCSASS